MDAHRELQVTGARLRYRDEGTGPAVVLVHGWTLDLDVWEPQTSLATEMRVVLEFAATRPGRVRGLVLDGPPSLVTDDDEIRFDELQQLAAREGLEAFRRTWRSHPFMQLVNGDARASDLLARMLARYPGRDLLAGEAAVRETLDARLLAGIRTPTLIINGARDTIARRRAGAALQAALPQAERVLIQDAAHLPNLDSPREYNRLMSGFARRHLPAAA